MPSELLTQVELGQEWNKSEAWLEQRRYRGTGPPYVKIGRSVFYLREDAYSWLVEQRRTCTRQTAANPAVPAVRKQARPQPPQGGQATADGDPPSATVAKADVTERVDP
jgi:hypothetical protein